MFLKKQVDETETEKAEFAEIANSLFFLYLFKHFLQRFLFFLNCGRYLCHAGGISQEDCTAKNPWWKIGSSQNLILFILDFNGF